MLTAFQRMKIGAAAHLLKAAGLKTWFDVRVIRDSDKKLFGAQLAVGPLDELLPKLEARRAALRPDCRLELRMYATVVEKRGTFMGQDIEPPGTVVIGTAPPFDQWKRSNALKPRARAAGVALPPAESQHVCDQAGPMRQREAGGSFYPTCSICGAFL